MKKVNYKFEYTDERLYNICDVIENFQLYFGLSLEQMIELFQNYNIISKENLSEHIDLHLKKIMEYQEDSGEKEIHHRVTMEYQYLSKVLNILSIKGLEYLSLFQYLKRLDNRLEKIIPQKEEQLEELGIFHYHSVIIGVDIKRILIALENTLKYFELNLNRINYFKTFHQKVRSSFNLSCGNRSYPEISMSANNEIFYDETSIPLKKNYSKKRKKSMNY